MTAGPGLGRAIRPVAWMTGVSVVAWLVVTVIAGDRVNPEVLLGMAGPLVSASVTWVIAERVYSWAPERLTAVMVIGLASKMIFFGVYVAVMLRGLDLRPIPFVAGFTSFFITLHVMEALFLRRLLMDDARPASGGGAGN